MKINMLFASLIASILISVSFASAQDATLYIDPPSIVSQSLKPGSNFTVDVNIKNVDELYGFDFKLGYDTKILDGVYVSTNPFLNSPTYIGKREIDEDAGVVWVAVTSWHPAGPVSGSGTLATITFQVVKRGNSVLDLYGTKLADFSIEPVPHEVEDGYFNNKPGQACKEKWTCTDWSECVNGIQTRTCYDLNECGTEEHRPKEERKCRVKASASGFQTPTPGTITEILSYPFRVAAEAIQVILALF